MSSVEFTAEVVRGTTFREKFRGYHPEEVDAFLERTATAVELLQTWLTELTERALKAERALESNSEADESIRKTLTLAQRTADMAVKEASDDAERIRAEARTYADGLRTSAEEGLEAARADAATIVADAQRQADDQQRRCAEEVEALRRDAAERIDEAQQRADAEIAARAEEARRELEDSIATLTAQRDGLCRQLEALTSYLAGERARVLDALATAIERFPASLNLSPRPDPVDQAMDAMAAESDPVEMVDPVEMAESVEMVDPVEMADPGPADVWFAADTDPQPASEPIGPSDTGVGFPEPIPTLLFTMAGEGEHRAGAGQVDGSDGEIGRDAGGEADSGSGEADSGGAFELLGATSRKSLLGRRKS